MYVASSKDALVHKFTNHDRAWCGFVWQALHSRSNQPPTCTVQISPFGTTYVAVGKPKHAVWPTQGGRVLRDTHAYTRHVYPSDKYVHIYTLLHLLLCAYLHTLLLLLCASTTCCSHTIATPHTNHYYNTTPHTPLLPPPPGTPSCTILPSQRLNPLLLLQGIVGSLLFLYAPQLAASQPFRLSLGTLALTVGSLAVLAMVLAR